MKAVVSRAFRFRECLLREFPLNLHFNESLPIRDMLLILTRVRFFGKVQTRILRIFFTEIGKRIMNHKICTSNGFIKSNLNPAI